MAYNENLSLVDAIELTDLDYDKFLKENAVFFECWNGALNHEQLCRISIYVRYKYIDELNEFIKEKQKNQNNGG